MGTFDDQLAKAERLDAITHRVGYALWQLQELEGATAQFYVQIVQATPGMGVAAGEALTEKALSKTFGSTITQLVKAKRLPNAMEARFKALLSERNWLVHSSRSTNRKAVHEDDACHRLIQRLDRIADEALALLIAVGTHAEAFAKKHGVSTNEIDRLVAETLKKWHGEDPL
ncbi:MAG: hypothetical protein JWN85_3076 [Gammaproteobacteria bacterium]|nr:hypothetical protein [Gammaproteobacteria bacterium]